MKTPEIHLMDMMAGWHMFVEDEPREYEGEPDKLYNLYQESANIFGLKGEVLSKNQEQKIRQFFEEKVFPYIFNKENQKYFAVCSKDGGIFCVTTDFTDREFQNAEFIVISKEEFDTYDEWDMHYHTLQEILNRPHLSVNKNFHLQEVL